MAAADYHRPNQTNKKDLRAKFAAHLWSCYMTKVLSRQCPEQSLRQQGRGQPPKQY